MPLELGHLNYLINHLSLPPDLPQENDSDAELTGVNNNNNVLLNFISERAQAFAVPTDEVTATDAWDVIRRMLLGMRSAHKGKKLDPEVGKIIDEMEENDVLPLHITEQNAAVIIRKHPTVTTFEYFQPCPSSTSVLDTAGKLAIQFPSSPRLSIPHDDLSFVDPLVRYLLYADSTPYEDALPVAPREGMGTSEVPDFRMVSEVLGGILRGLGGDEDDGDDDGTETVWKTKRIDDHVLGRTMHTYWRRSPKWLITRVAIQTTLGEWRIPENGPYGYKAFITYALSDLLGHARAAIGDISPDRIFTINAKLARRISKLAPTPDEMLLFPFSAIHLQIRLAGELLSERWEDTILAESRSGGRVDVPVHAADVAVGRRFPLDKCRGYLHKVSVRRAALAVVAENAFDATGFDASLAQRGGTTARHRKVIPRAPVPVAISADMWIAVVELEEWDMTAWMARTAVDEQLRVLKGYLCQLIDVAMLLNKAANPYSFSRVFLLALEFWVLIDTTVVKTLTTLVDYSPQLCVEDFEPLLLPTQHQLERLSAVEEYIEIRHERARHNDQDAFQWNAHPSSFVCRFFNDETGGNDLKTLQKRIERQITADKAAKKTEFNTLLAQFTALHAEANDMRCSQRQHRDPDTDEPTFYHDPNCAKCAILARARNMSITVYEEALPEDAYERKCVVFELMVPTPFGVWRDVTYKLAQSFSSVEHQQATLKRSPAATLKTYAGLRKFYTLPNENVPHTVSAASTTDGARASKSFPCLLEDVVVENSLNFGLRDEARGEWLGPLFPLMALRERCTPQLPVGAYKLLSWTVSSTEHRPNEVIARQSACPVEMSVHEWDAYGHLRSGVHLQWRNMLLQLEIGTVSLGHEAVWLLFCQAAWQVEQSLVLKEVDADGEDDDDFLGEREPVRMIRQPRRAAHRDLEDEEFGKDVLRVLNGRLERIEENWEERWTAATLSVVACRVFSLTTSEVVKTEMVRFLGKLRNVLRGWMARVLQLEKINSSTAAGTAPPALNATTTTKSSPEDKSAIDLRDCILQLAAACRSTYEVGSAALEQTFQESPLAIQTFIHCAIVLENHMPHDKTALSPPLRYLIERDQVLAVEVHAMLATLASSGDYSEGFDDAVRCVWEGFTRAEEVDWRIVQHRWITCSTEVDVDTQSRHVHLDLISGSILVDGKALGYLPKNMLKDDLFQLLFPAQAITEVTPSTMKGMTYQLRYNIDDTEVHFSRIDEVLVIRTSSDDHGVSEFIAGSKLEHDIPNHLRLGFVHVYHETAQQLDFYPIPKTGWTPSLTPTWRMPLPSDPINGGFSLEKLDSDSAEVVITPVCALAQRFAQVFKPLESSVCDLFIVWKSANGHDADGAVRVALPRFGFAFTVGSDGAFHSQELPGMVVSKTQSVKTLVGLQSKLVLSATDEDVSPVVIIPQGEIAFARENHNAIVRIAPPDDATRIHSTIFDVDDLIGRLVARDGSLTSWFLLAYLHILTSSQVHDPLTGCTGIQQAITMLRASRSLTFMHLSLADYKLLEQIMATAPTHLYYPKHANLLENVTWNPALSVLSQNDNIPVMVQIILNFAQEQEVLSPETEEEKKKNTIKVTYKGKDPLRIRAAFRNAKYFPVEYNTLRKVSDLVVQPARCLLEKSDSEEKEGTVHCYASLVQRWPAGNELAVTNKIWSWFETWSENGSFSIRPIEGSSLNDPKTWFTGEPHRIWFTLCALCQDVTKEQDLYGLAFALGIMSYRIGDFPAYFLQTVLAMAVEHPSARFRNAMVRLPGPIGDNYSFDVRSGYTLTAKDIQKCAIRSNPYVVDQREPGERKRTWETRVVQEQARHNRAIDEQSHNIAQTLAAQWPIAALDWSQVRLANRPDIDVDAFRMETNRIAGLRFRNHLLHIHAEKMKYFFRGMLPSTATELELFSAPRSPAIILPSRRAKIMTLATLLAGREPPIIDTTLPGVVQRLDAPGDDIDMPEAPSTEPTRQLVERLRVGDTNNFVPRYTDDTLRCVDALRDRETAASDPAAVMYSGEYLSTVSPESMKACLEPQPDEGVYDILRHAGLAPNIGPRMLLHQLSQGMRQNLPDEWKVIFVRYAEALSNAQRERRLSTLQRLGQDAEYMKEAQNPAGQGWNSETYLDWLLIQLDANMLIRPVQASVALSMMNPPDGENSAIQLNMGEGKSSVIVPIASATLADCEQLVRVVVLKPLVSQTFDVLKQRICGLANRRLFYLPFRRDLPLTLETTASIINMFKTCARVGGVLIAQPEHILSFKLIGLDSFSQRGSTDDQTRVLLDGQQWLDDVSRDILDESDEILSVRYQLIYTVGSSGPLEGQPTRWQTIQEVLSLLAEEMTRLAPNHLEGIDIEHTDAPEPDRFLRTRILTQEMGKTILAAVADQIVTHGRLSSTPFRSYSTQNQTLARRFITVLEMAPESIQRLKEFCGDFFSHLLLLRGLIAHGILLMCFKEKRWRVEYGLDPVRTMLAVPYRAKDVPASRAEFGHPDIILVLTCLSYYYGGLTDKQLDIAFHCLRDSDNPASRYEEWIAKSIDTLPDSLHNLNGLNLSDVEQKTKEIFPRLRYNKGVIDFFLSEWVFPKEAKQFPHKLTTNAWDLACTKASGKPTTGFSGTNDNRYLLPLSITQLDSEEQRHTNAEVLQFILRVENRSVVCTETDGASALIARLVAQQPYVMVLLDVGAQVLELQNEDVAKEWLALDTRASVEAAMYFDSHDDEPYVLTRDGRRELLASSIYKSQLDKTLVYLDEAHTRGTDFKFPPSARAVVTLGPKLTKDKLMQGCMRMRKLGSVHSVCFFASSEIYRKIRSIIGREVDPTGALDSSDVLEWAMRETCRQTCDNGAMWASQGRNFDARITAWEQFQQGVITSEEAAAILQEKEAHTLEELYGFRDDFDGAATGLLSERQISIRQRCREFGIDEVSGNSTLMEEQERELAHEKENEREVERARGAEAMEHKLSRYLKAFISHGDNSNLLSLAACLENTSQYDTLGQIGVKFLHEFHLCATDDFRDTIKIPPGNMDSFLRVVQWIVSSEEDPETLVLISPYEANIILPELRTSQTARLHVYAPRVSRNVRTLDDLSFFPVPRLRPNQEVPANREMMHELNLFAGQLFFNDQQVYAEVGEFLGLYLDAVPQDQAGDVDASGFVKYNDVREALGMMNECWFEHSPVKFLRELMGWRRKGQGFDRTHMRILYGNALHESEFEPREDEFEPGAVETV